MIYHLVLMHYNDRPRSADPLYTPPGGALYTHPGGALYTHPGGALYTHPGGARQTAQEEHEAYSEGDQRLVSENMRKFVGDPCRDALDSRELHKTVEERLKMMNFRSVLNGKPIHNTVPILLLHNFSR